MIIMRGDQQLIENIVQATQTQLSETARALYEQTGSSAVCEWGQAVGLKFEACVPCEANTPTIGRWPLQFACAVCGTKQ